MKYNDTEIYDLFNQYINAKCTEITILGIEYRISGVARLLKEEHPTDYNCQFNDWLDSELKSNRLYLLTNESDTYTNTPVYCQNCDAVYDVDDEAEELTYYEPEEIMACSDCIPVLDKKKEANDD